MGYYVMGKHTSRAWYPTKEEAEKEVKRILMVGNWSGVPPRIEKVRENNQEV